MLQATLLLGVACGCSAQPSLQPSDPGLSQLAIAELHPALVLPGTDLALLGRGFVDASRGQSRLRLRGRFTDAAGAAHAVDLTLPADFVDGTHLHVGTDAGFPARLGGARGRFDGGAAVIVDSAVDGLAHASAEIVVGFDVADALAPTLTAAQGGARFVNDAIELDGSGFLLGGGEGALHAIVDGCFTPAGASQCTTLHGDVTARPAAAWDRTRALFPWLPSLTGIGPGAFLGTVTVVDALAGGASASAGTLPLSLTIQPPAIAAITPSAASLGQLVDVSGGGFIGAAGDEVTLLHLTGTFQPAAGAAAALDLLVVPRFVDGGHLRYVLDEADALGQTIDLRRTTGAFDGQVTPIVRKGAVEVVGQPRPAQLTIAPVKQVVYVRFLPSYVDSLARYGLAAADAAVRARIFAVGARDYAGVNLELRDTPPDDFLLYEEVDVEGPDPNGLGLFGYDNTPGKDVGNQRLFDRIGGVNASTQVDGYPGYGGIFTEEFLAFSAHPGASIEPLPTTTPAFDAIFDPLRPDTGTPASAAEAQALTALADGTSCPARERAGRLACAVLVLGNLVGTTLTHEVGHSLGLADPTGELFHDPGDAPDRLMDAGDDRPFEERAELDGQGPGVFCDDEYTYLRTILPGVPAVAVARPGCGAP